MTVGIRWLSYGPTCGYGEAAVGYLSGLRAAGVPVTWTPLGWPSPRWRAPLGPVEVGSPGIEPSPHADIADLEIEHDTVVVDSTPLWHDALVEETAGRRLVAYSTWETDRLPENSVEILNRYDAVLVPSRFNAEVFARSGVTRPVFVVPHIAPSWELGEPRHDPGAPFVFYVIATWTTRKAVLDTVFAFVDAFDASDPVVLVVHTTPVDYGAAGRRPPGAPPPHRFADATWFTLAEALGGRAGLPAIRLSTRRLSAAEMRDLHARGDCLVSLSRGEGWGLAPFEAAAAGRPLVVVRWGGLCDYVPPDYPYCADFELVETTADPRDEWSTGEGWGRWARVDRAHASALLREVFEHRDEARALGAELARGVTEAFAPGPVTERLIAALDGVSPRADRAQTTSPSAARAARPAATSDSGAAARP